MNSRTFSIKTSKRLWLWMLAFFILIRPIGVIQVFGIEAISRLAQYVVICLFTIVCSKKTKYLYLPTKLYIAYLVWLMTATILFSNFESIRECFIMVLVNLYIVLFVNYILHKNTRMALKAMMIVYAMLLIINIFAILFFPRGLYNTEMFDLYERGNWIFGHANSTITYVLPAICVSLLYSQYQKSKKTLFVTYLIVVIAIVNIILIQSMTSIIGLVILFITFYFLKIERGLKIFTLKKGLIISSILFVGIVIFHAQIYFKDFFENVLNRTITFTSRTIIWEQTIAAIRNGWFWGLGYHNNTFWKELIHGSSAHNEYLYCLIQGGIFLLAIFYGLLLSLAKILDKTIDKYVSKLFIAIVFCLLIQFIVETHMHRIAVLLTLLGNAELFNSVLPLRNAANINKVN